MEKEISPKVKLKLFLRKIYERDLVKSRHAAELFNTFDPLDPKSEVTPELFKKVKETILSILKNEDMYQIAQYIFFIERDYEYNIGAKREYINPSSRRYQRPSFEELVEDSNFIETFQSLYERNGKRLPVACESKRKELNGIEKIIHVKIIERNHTTDINQQLLFQKKKEIKNTLNKFLVKKMLKKLFLDKLKKKEKRNQLIKIRFNFFKSEKFTEEKKIKSRIIMIKNFYKDLKQKERMPKKPPDKTEIEILKGKNENFEKKIREENRKCKKYKKVKNRCSIEEQREIMPERLKPPDTSWIKR